MSLRKERSNMRKIRSASYNDPKEYTEKCLDGTTKWVMEFSCNTYDYATREAQACVDCIEREGNVFLEFVVFETINWTQHRRAKADRKKLCFQIITYYRKLKENEVIRPLNVVAAFPKQW